MPPPLRITTVTSSGDTIIAQKLSEILTDTQRLVHEVTNLVKLVTTERACPEYFQMLLGGSIRLEEVFNPRVTYRATTITLKEDDQKLAHDIFYPTSRAPYSNLILHTYGVTYGEAKKSLENTLWPFFEKDLLLEPLEKQQSHPRDHLWREIQLRSLIFERTPSRFVDDPHNGTWRVHIKEIRLTINEAKRIQQFFSQTTVQNTLAIESGDEEIDESTRVSLEQEHRAMLLEKARATNLDDLLNKILTDPPVIEEKDVGDEERIKRRIVEKPKNETTICATCMVEYANSLLNYERWGELFMQAKEIGGMTLVNTLIDLGNDKDFTQDLIGAIKRQGMTTVFYTLMGNETFHAAVAVTTATGSKEPILDLTIDNSTGQILESRPHHNPTTLHLSLGVQESDMLPFYPGSSKKNHFPEPGDDGWSGGNDGDVVAPGFDTELLELLGSESNKTQELDNNHKYQGKHDN